MTHADEHAQRSVLRESLNGANRRKHPITQVWHRALALPVPDLNFWSLTRSLAQRVNHAAVIVESDTVPGSGTKL